MHCRAVVRERGEPRLESGLGRKHSKKEHAFHLLLAGSCGREVTFIAITHHLHALVILVQRVLVTTDLPSWDLQLRSDPYFCPLLPALTTLGVRLSGGRLVVA